MFFLRKKLVRHVSGLDKALFEHRGVFLVKLFLLSSDSGSLHYDSIWDAGGRLKQTSKKKKKKALGGIYIYIKSV